MELVYLITGASSGIGKYLFETLLGRGNEVFGTCHSSTVKDEYLDRISKVDISVHSQVEQWMEGLKLTDNIVLINCAGISYNSFLHKSDPNQWAKVIGTNLIGTYHVIREVLPYMRTNKYGRIINMSSVVAQKSIPGTSAYAASKSALWGLTKSLVPEGARLGITINNINLGYMDAGIIRAVPEKMLEKLKNEIPVGHLGSVEDIYQTIEYITGNDFLTGTSIDLNGGLF
ncbi:SDR family NAD(P)-dependent oxidoreductase [Emcibacteraceae bacterium]|nr:SDR family NAD(P)-dependent oxidoreductase [Emcibacteraceae bacterium]